MSDSKSAKLNIREDKSTAISSSMQGSNLDAIGFNLIFLALRNPKLAVEVIELYNKAYQVKEADPKAPDEDFELFSDALATVLDSTSDDN